MIAGMPAPPVDHPYDRGAVEALPPELHGCYSLYAADVCVYVGVGQYRERLLSHLGGDNYCVAMHRPTHWREYPTSDPHDLALRLVRELRPRCNRRVDPDN